jgi:polysaccharide pyruvyl transferase WcaK-like protein
MNNFEQTKINLHYISASDRLNYGDLLFPIIFKEYFCAENSNYTFHNYGVVRSDLSKFGALPTASFRDLERTITKTGRNVLIVGGGEVLVASWSRLYSYINSFFLYLLRYRTFNKLEKKWRLAKRLLSRSKSISPFIPDLKTELVYVSVGGKINAHKPAAYKTKVASVLQNSLYLSVRDNKTKLSLNQNNVYPELVPDSALLMSKVFPIGKLKKMVGGKMEEQVEGKYIFLQLARYKGPKDIEKFARDIARIAEEQECMVICSPIGIAAGHEDQVVLNKLSAMGSPFRYIHPESIFETMYLIANAQIYCGTSLHGAITAYAFNKPIILFNKNIKKLDSFVETWCSDFYSKCINYSELSTAYEQILSKWDASKAKQKLAQDQKAIEESFVKIGKLITESV